MDRKDFLTLRDQLEQAIEARCGEGIVTFTGGATGTCYGYLDFIAWDLRTLLDAAVEVFAGRIPPCPPPGGRRPPGCAARGRSAPPSCAGSPGAGRSPSRERCYFAPSARSEEDACINAAILDDLERAAKMDPSLPLPRGSYEEVCFPPFSVRPSRPLRAFRLSVKRASPSRAR